MKGMAPTVERTPYAVRLETVRLEVGARTLRAFHDMLCELPDFYDSYESARYYHTTRDPSPDYLAAVVRRFKVHASWLLTGGYDG